MRSVTFRGRPTMAAASFALAVLAASGCGPGDVLKTTVFLQTMDDFAAVNAIYAATFGAHKPARATVAVADLPLGALVEVDAIARVPERS